jgi:hypothetical protein
MFGCQSREVGPLTAAVVAQISSSPAAQNDGVISPVPETLSFRRLQPSRFTSPTDPACISAVDSVGYIVLTSYPSNNIGFCSPYFTKGL